MILKPHQRLALDCSACVNTVQIMARKQRRSRFDMYSSWFTFLMFLAVMSLTLLYQNDKSLLIGKIVRFLELIPQFRPFILAIKLVIDKTRPSSSGFRFHRSAVTKQTKGPHLASIARMSLAEVKRRLFEAFPTVKTKYDQIDETVSKHWKKIDWITEPVTRYAGAAYEKVPRPDLILTAAGTATTLLIMRKGFKRYRTAQEIPLDFFRNQMRLKGIAMLVNDSDNLRFYHTSFFSRLIWYRPSVKRSDLKYETINVRLAGIDAPEMAHFGGDCQPFAKEAKDWLTKYVEGKRVTVKLHRFDQYSRAVATVHVGRIWKKNLSVEMVKAGFATIYEDSGAEYGDYEQLLRKYLKEARAKRRGMWQQDPKNYTSPSDYKKQLRQASQEVIQEKVAAQQKKWAFWQQW